MRQCEKVDRKLAPVKVYFTNRKYRAISNLMSRWMRSLELSHRLHRPT